MRLKILSEKETFTFSNIFLTDVIKCCLFIYFYLCRALASDVSNWTKTEVVLEANGTDNGARLQFTTTKKGSIWFDQVSAMPMDTYKVC